MLVYESLDFVLDSQAERQEVEDAGVDLAEEARPDKKVVAIFRFSKISWLALRGCPEVA